MPYLNPGTEISNPALSSGESSNFRFLARPPERCHPGMIARVCLRRRILGCFLKRNGFNDPSGEWR